GRRIARHRVGEAEATVEAARTLVVLEHLKREPAAARAARALLGRPEQRSADAAPSVGRQHGEVVDIEQRLRVKRRKTEEAGRDADGLTGNESKQDQRRRMIA